MNLLTPLGLIALIGILILFLIYIIKPSYQTKLLPSTYIWKESLKYKKSDRPTSKLRNILIIICQILIIVLCSLILATPFVNTKESIEGCQDILIIDGSANMQIEFNGESRFDRAVKQIKAYSEDSIKKKNSISIIVAGTKSTYIAKNERDLTKISNNLNEAKCSLSNGDIEGAMKLASEQVNSTTKSKLYLYTATKYDNVGDVNVIDVSNEEDWNAAVLDVRPEINENWYEFEIDVLVSGKDKYVNTVISFTGVNDQKETKTIDKRVNCVGNEIVTIELKDLGIYAYDTVDVSISMDDGSVDSFNYDDNYSLYGGRKEVLNIQYYSLAPNNFFNSALFVLKDKYKDRFDIHISNPKEPAEAKNRGFDFYIYEHDVPASLPKDGVVFIVNPNVLPSKLGVKLGSPNKGKYKLTSSVTHPIMKYINAQNISATTYRSMKSTDFETLMYCGEDSVFMVKEDENSKIAIMTLDLNRSNLPLLIEFPLLINNMFEYFLPATLNNNVFEINSDIQVTARGKNVKLVDGKEKIEIDSNGIINIDKVGKYSIEQALLSNKKVTCDFYVKTPLKQSNIYLEQEEIEGLFEIKEPDNLQKDILMYLAIAVFVLLFIERILHSLENV